MYTRLLKYQIGDLSAERISREVGRPIWRGDRPECTDSREREVEVMTVWRSSSLTSRNYASKGGGEEGD